MKKFKKIIISLTVICTIIFAGVSLTGCKSNSKIYLNDVYAMGMMSAVNFFEANSTSSLKLGGLNSASASIPDANTKDTLSNYIQMFEGFFNYGVNPIESALTAEDEKYSDYAKKISLTIGNECYIMYYNEVLEGTTQEFDEDEIEEKTLTFLYGKAVRTIGEDTLELNLVGSREIEKETENGIIETENELTLLFSKEELVAKDTDSFEDINLQTLSNYVLIEQEVEDDEIGFEYTTKFGASFNSVEVEWENKKGKEELGIEIKQDGQKTEYKIKKSSDKKYEVRSNKNKFLFNIINENGNFNFVDKEGKEI